MSNKAMVFPDSLSSRGRSTERVKILTFLLALMICITLACIQPPHQYLIVLMGYWKAANMSNKAMALPDSLSSGERSTERGNYPNCCTEGLSEIGEDKQGYGVPGLPVLWGEEH